MKKLKNLGILMLLSILFFSCGDPDPLLVCDETSSEFQSLFLNMINAGHTDDITFDTEIHEYTFTLSANKEVCKIGYQSQPGLASTPYDIKIVDNVSNVTIYLDAHIFSSTATSYVIPTSTLNLQAGVSYTIQRIQTNWGTNIGLTIGRLARKDPMNFPYSNGIMTISSADFYQNGGPLTNLAVPYIDLILR